MSTLRIRFEKDIKEIAEYTENYMLKLICKYFDTALNKRRRRDDGWMDGIYCFFQVALGGHFLLFLLFIFFRVDK